MYGGIGGASKEKEASGPIYFGHFAYGDAEVVYDDIAGEPRFEIVYQQVYCQNADGLIAGALHMSRYLGDRQFGWAGLRPTCNVLLKLDAFTGDFRIGERAAGSALDALLLQLAAMTSRYRIGDGTGATYVGAANNCAQDSNRALFGALEGLDAFVSIARVCRMEELQWRRCGAFRTARCPSRGPAQATAAVRFAQARLERQSVQSR